MYLKAIPALASFAILFSTGGSAAAQFGPNAPLGGAIENRAVVYSKLINTHLPVDFSADSLRDVVQFLAAYAEIDILAQWDETGFGDGLDPEALITVQLRNPTSVESILEVVLKQATSEETAWNLGDGFIEIGLKEVLIQDKYVRSYPVRELLFTVPTFENAPEMDLESVLGGGDTGEITGYIFEPEDENDDDDKVTPEMESAHELMDLITSIIDPLQWETNGGEGGSIRYFKGALIINASDFLHRQVGGYPFLDTAARRVVRQASTLQAGADFAGLLELEDDEIPILVVGG